MARTAKLSAETVALSEKPPRDLPGAAAWPRGGGGGDREEGRRAGGRLPWAQGRKTKQKTKDAGENLTKVESYRGGFARQRGSGGGHASVLALLHQQQLALPSH